MEEEDDENSITDRSIIANAIDQVNLVGAAQTEEENQVREGTLINFSPPRQIVLQQAQSPVVHLQNEFDDINGYDSDEGPFYDAVNEEGPLIEEEEVLPDDSTPPEVEEVVAEVVEAEEDDRFVFISDADIDKLRVAELKEELKKRGLVLFGKKAELIERLKQGMALRVPLQPIGAGNVRNRNVLQIAGFSVTAKWKLLEHLQEEVQEPVNTFASHAPTVPAEDAAFVPIKHNFAEKFQRDDFTGVDRVPKIHKNKKVMKDRNGVTMYEDKVRQYGIPDVDFLKRNKLTYRSTPVKFVEAFLPVSDDVYKETKCSIERWCRYTNLKAMLSFAGEKNYPYPDFKPFTVAEF
jgi:SAP domain